jgi:RNA polymerase sigma-70 factor (ECF subfamily)
VKPAAADGKRTVDEFVATFGPSLRRFLLSCIRNSAEVPDLLQEVYLRMLRVPNLESIRSPEAYLYTIARHVVHQDSLRRVKGRQAVQAMELPEGSAVDPDADPAQQLVAQQTLDTLERTLEQLSPKVRACFLLHRRDGLSVDEIATRLGISRPMVKKYLVRALMRLRKQLEPID